MVHVSLGMQSCLPFQNMVAVSGDKLPGGRKAVSRRGGSPGYQQAEIKPYEGTPLQAAWVDLRIFLKVTPWTHCR